MTRKHPDALVQLFVETDPEPVNLMRAIQSLPRPLPVKVEAALVLLGAVVGAARLDDHLDKINCAFSERSDVDLHILFLIAYFRALHFLDPEWARIKAIQDRILSLISDRTPPEIAAWARLVQARTAHQRGDSVTCLSLTERLLDGISPTSPHYRRLAALQVLTYYHHGMGAAAEPPPPLSSVGSIYEHRFHTWRVVNNALTGVLDPTLRMGAETPPSGAISDMQTASYRSAWHVLHLLAEYRGAPAPSLPSAPGEADGEQPAWVVSTRHLLERRPAEALEWARIHVRNKPSGQPSVVGFDEYTLVRAELAAGHGEAARYLLRRRDERGSRHFVDEWFYARTELLAGNNQRAAGHFGRFLRMVETYGASGRLDFETGLACELSASQLLELARPGSEAPAREVGASLAPRTPALPAPRAALERLVGISQPMRAMRERIARFAAADAPVLISGETGTGKELVAQALHEGGPRAAAPFVALNCGAISDALVESELFGHERGAFTGAQVAYKGLFREAGKGTIFLDEIGDITPKLQLALLRVLESGETRPVGSSRRHRIACRVVAATNADLPQRVNEGTFRQDLLYRLQRLELHLPPLRDRVDDITPLAEHFLNIDRVADQRATITPTLRAAMARYPWPGNVRELRNVIERMRVLESDKATYHVDDLQSVLSPPAKQPARWRGAAHGHTASASSHEGAASYLAQGRSALRRQRRLEQLFEQFRELKTSEVAHLLGVSRVTARRDLEQLGARGLIEKVMPSACRSSHYYTWAAEPPSSTS